MRLRSNERRWENGGGVDMTSPPLSQWRDNMEEEKKDPTVPQIERCIELLDHPAITPHLDDMLKRIDALIKTKGGTGVLLGWMKKKINEGS